MNDNAKIGVAVAGGYLLGRTKKARLALGLGMYLAGKKLSLDPKQLRQMVMDNPVLSGLGDQVRTELVGATKSAATAALTRRAGSLADSLRDRTQVLQGQAGPAKGEKDEPEDEPEEHDEDDEAEQHDRDDDFEDADEEQPAKAPRRKTATRASGKATGTSRTQAKASGKASDDEDAERPRRKAANGSRSSSGSARGTARKSSEPSGRKAPARKTAARRTSTRGGDDA
ncbi:hypothetical protein ABT071_10385 [Streptomyces sp. NPDC002506]|uniref:hypothetical protein n=1 Tax=Streptomyces sp. NPDC002506 TaxID=3154536 RepID=UPI00331F6DD4